MASQMYIIDKRIPRHALEDLISKCLYIARYTYANGYMQ